MKIKSLLLLTCLFTCLSFLNLAVAATKGCYVNIQGEKMSFKGGCSEHGPHGYGLAQTADGKFKYQGQFVHGKMHGKGQLTTAKYTYTGGFKNSQEHGQGKFVTKTGIVYVGAFVNGQFQGKGTLNLGGGERYVGGFRLGKQHGKGRYEFSSGNYLNQ